MPQIRKLTPANPLPENRKTDEPIGETGVEFARDGFSVLSRANPDNSFNPQRQRLAPDVYDRPQPDWEDWQ
jgi:hypothetical protein